MSLPSRDEIVRELVRQAPSRNSELKESVFNQIRRNEELAPLLPKEKKEAQPQQASAPMTEATPTPTAKPKPEAVEEPEAEPVAEPVAEAKAKPEPDQKPSSVSKPNIRILTAEEVQREAEIERERVLEEKRERERIALQQKEAERLALAQEQERREREAREQEMRSIEAERARQEERARAEARAEEEAREREQEELKEKARREKPLKTKEDHIQRALQLASEGERSLSSLNDLVGVIAKRFKLSAPDQSLRDRMLRLEKWKSISFGSEMNSDFLLQLRACQDDLDQSLVSLEQASEDWKSIHRPLIDALVHNISRKMIRALDDAQIENDEDMADKKSQKLQLIEKIEKKYQSFF